MRTAGGRFGSPADVWRAYWFPAVPVERLAVLRILMCGYVLLDLLLESGYATGYPGVDAAFYDPIRLIELLGLPRLTPDTVEIVRLVLIAAAGLALLGVRTRLALTVTALGYLYWFAQDLSYHWIHHAKVVPVIALFVLALAPSGAAHSVDVRGARRRREPEPGSGAEQVAGWVFQVLFASLAIVYFGSAVNKVRSAGFGWWTAGGFERAIARFGTDFARNLAEHHLWLVDLMALGALVFEFGAPLLLVSGALRKAYAGAAIVFHLSTSILTGLHFFGWIVVCLGAFALERVPAALSARARGARPHPVAGPGSRRAE